MTLDHINPETGDVSRVLFQSMPPLSPDEYAALEASIREHGIQVPIIVDEDNVVIDGHHRQKIAAELGIPCPKRHVFDLADVEKRTLSLSLNLDRRHLSRDQRRALVAESIKADPGLSNRQHAERVGVDHKTVQAVRVPMEQRGEIPHVSERTDSAGRQQPAVRPAPQSPTAAPVERPTQSEVDDAEHGTHNPAASRPVVGLDGKTYTRPAPSAPKRRPLADQAHDAAANLTAALERVERIFTDDRFTQNREQVGEVTRAHLLRTAQVCQHLAEQLPS